MNPADRTKLDLPVWAKPDAFPPARPGWGWLDVKKRPHSCPSAHELVATIRNDREAGVLLAWTPEHERMILPEEVEGAADAVLVARKRRAADDLLDSHDKLRWFSLILAGLAAWMLYQGWSRSPDSASAGERVVFALRAASGSVSIGVGLLVFLVFAFIPWYQARKRLRALARWNEADLAAIIPLLRFETWLEWQKAPATRLLMGLVLLVALAQMFGHDSISSAGLVKSAYRHGDWWRLLTAPLMHGNLLHLLMNGAALLYLGKRVEVFARWPHVPLVFLFAAFVGGEASARFVLATSVGASGGLMGWLGFLLVFESLHGRLVPQKARRRLLAGVLLTALIGVIGFRFIDNAAHAGGLLAGMLYAAIVFPKSNSPNRPNSTLTDRIAGTAAFAVLGFSTLLALLKILRL